MKSCGSMCGSRKKCGGDWQNSLHLADHCFEELCSLAPNHPQTKTASLKKVYCKCLHRPPEENCVPPGLQVFFGAKSYLARPTSQICWVIFLSGSAVKTAPKTPLHPKALESGRTRTLCDKDLFERRKSLSGSISPLKPANQVGHF